MSRSSNSFDFHSSTPNLNIPRIASENKTGHNSRTSLQEDIVYLCDNLNIEYQPDIIRNNSREDQYRDQMDTNEIGNLDPRFPRKKGDTFFNSQKTYGNEQRRNISNPSNAFVVKGNDYEANMTKNQKMNSPNLRKLRSPVPNKRFYAGDQDFTKKELKFLCDELGISIQEFSNLGRKKLAHLFVSNLLGTTNDFRFRYNSFLSNERSHLSFENSTEKASSSCLQKKKIGYGQNNIPEGGYRKVPNSSIPGYQRNFAEGSHRQVQNNSMPGRQNKGTEGAYSKVSNSPITGNQDNLTGEAHKKIQNNSKPDNQNNFTEGGHRQAPNNSMPGRQNNCTEDAYSKIPNSSITGAQENLTRGAIQKTPNNSLQERQRNFAGGSHRQAPNWSIPGRKSNFPECVQRKALNNCTPDSPNNFTEGNYKRAQKNSLSEDDEAKFDLLCKLSNISSEDLENMNVKEFLKTKFSSNLIDSELNTNREDAGTSISHNETYLNCILKNLIKAMKNKTNTTFNKIEKETGLEYIPKKSTSINCDIIPDRTDRAKNEESPACYLFLPDMYIPNLNCTVRQLDRVKRFFKDIEKL